MRRKSQQRLRVNECVCASAIAYSLPEFACKHAALLNLGLSPHPHIKTLTPFDARMLPHHDFNRGVCLCVCVCLFICKHVTMLKHGLGTAGSRLPAPVALPLTECGTAPETAAYQLTWLLGLEVSGSNVLAGVAAGENCMAAVFVCCGEAVCAASL